MTLTALALALSVLTAPPQTGKAWQGRAHVTQYCRKCDSAWSRGACGRNQIGATVAATRRIPAGSRVELEGLGTFTVTDRGGGDRLRSRGENAWFDLLVKRCRQRCQWSANNVRWRIVSKPKSKPTKRERR